MERDLIHVLLVEDNPGDARLIELALAEVGSGRFRLSHVSRLCDAFEVINEDPCDVVLLDLSLPDAHGFETFVWMREASPHLPIILLTGIDDEGLAVSAVRRGAQDYLVKGQVNPSLLARAISYAIERQRSERARLQYSKQLELFHAMDRAVLSEQSFDTIAETVLRQLGDLVELQCALLISLDAGSGDSAIITAVGPEGLVPPGDWSPLYDAGACAAELAELDILAAPDIHDSDIPDGIVEVLSGLGADSAICATIRDSGRPVGVLVVGRATSGDIESDQLSVLREVADALALVVEQQRLRHEVRRHAAELEASLKEKETLLREIHHRVKNNLQTVASLLYLGSKATADATTESTLQESQDRIHSMALVHERLYESPDLASIEIAPYVRDLVYHLGESYRARARIRFDMAPEPIAIHIDTAISLGLIVNELVSNAFKHAFPHTDRDELLISISREDSQITLVIRDNGHGLPTGLRPETSRSLGLRLVTTLVNQHQGKLHLRNQGGTEAIVRIPLPAAT